MKSKEKEVFSYDFAISYAGEEKHISKGIYNAIKEKYSNYSIFFAPAEIDKLIGKNGEDFFENLFIQSKQVIVILSENYKRKEWTRYEWDIIKERSQENRCIPIKVDSVKILGFPSNYIYLSFDGDFDSIAEICIEKLIAFEKDKGIERPSEFINLLNKIENSEGALDKALQLVIDDRERSPLGKLDYPNDDFSPSYRIIGKYSLNYSKLRREEIRIDIEDKMTKEEVRFNIKYLTAKIYEFNSLDALKIFVYSSKATNFLGFEKYNVARADFAPYGDWSRSEEGFAYNLPISKFKWSIEFEESYFNKDVKIETTEEMSLKLISEALKKKKK